MTHILITDLREIRYMAYVPEHPSEMVNVDPVDAVAFEDAYQSALEKAKISFNQFTRP